MEMIRALLKGETGEGCSTAEALLLSEGEEEVTLVLFTMPGETLVLVVFPVEAGERLVLWMLVECVGEALAILLIKGGELVELGR